LIEACESPSSLTTGKLPGPEGLIVELAERLDGARG
jgi:hypothetical protein